MTELSIELGNLRHGQLAFEHVLAVKGKEGQEQTVYDTSQAGDSFVKPFMVQNRQA